MHRDGICVKDVGVGDLQRNDPAGKLLFADLDMQELIAGKSELLKDENIAVMLFEKWRIKQRKLRLDLNRLNITGFGHFLIIDLEAQFIDVIAQVRFVFVTNIQEDI